MKIVLIALLFGICQARPGSLEFFEKTQETFGPEFQEEAGEYIKDIDEAFHGKQTGKKYRIFTTMCDFHNFGLILARQIHCLPQKLKSTLFDIFSNGGCLKGTQSVEKISNNIDFCL